MFDSTFDPEFLPVRVEVLTEFREPMWLDCGLQEPDRWTPRELMNYGCEITNRIHLITNEKLRDGERSELALALKLCRELPGVTIEDALLLIDTMATRELIRQRFETGEGWVKLANGPITMVVRVGGRGEE
jgi:hypothetical protein